MRSNTAAETVMIRTTMRSRFAILAKGPKMCMARDSREYLGRSSRVFTVIGLSSWLRPTIGSKIWMLTTGACGTTGTKIRTVPKLMPGSLALEKSTTQRFGFVRRRDRHSAGGKPACRSLEENFRFRQMAVVPGQEPPRVGRHRDKPTAPRDKRRHPAHQCSLERKHRRDVFCGGSKTPAAFRDRCLLRFHRVTGSI